jgi:hypothetical protein
LKGIKVRSKDDYSIERLPLQRVKDAIELGQKALGGGEDILANFAKVRAKIEQGCLTNWCGDSIYAQALAAFLHGRSAESSGTANVRLVKHEVIPQCGSFEVRFLDGRPSKYVYWDDLPSRRLRPDLVTSDVALEHAKCKS